ncbi:succinate dehydrogenase/fumarate reductase iron-sulfur subunit [Aeromicrobium sp. YIM 150415]|uniref:succinate dehydrogenase/fumarate reductase iron-sulfur subunit n=1 Tax=Aeromicrobium sp. YIM 150415 TaxID=2803912 RepID=UPI001966A70A|nr:succinate dehydrogenase/fumarate reductase iron-sulfur subunit [Aeromicrobium sp. YIM 150415]MBM9461849.1 succinate dehydrogenase/fumarate reductase iron-sulfur subunit [Aeromicrobium sp. YIM 150415]MBM9463197.1 succinate dehydrogenase/fumarate reductase iron-sulfur subunit [Aeromicrobium sp. YIM 150415]
MSAAKAEGRAERVEVRVHRSSEDSASSFTVDRITPMTVLDVLLAIQREHDDSLGFRFSCRVAMCGTCTVRVNGRSVLACQRIVERGEQRIDIAPAAGMPVIRDLIVDTSPFWEQWQRVVPYVSPEDGRLPEPAVVAPDSAERQAIDPALDCIQCGACYSSCGFAGDDGQFIGPAALNRAFVLISDSRDTAGQERLDIIEGHDGVGRCHFMYGCTGVCPKGLDPARAIRAARTGRMKDR